MRYALRQLLSEVLDGASVFSSPMLLLLIAIPYFVVFSVVQVLIFVSALYLDDHIFGAPYAKSSLLLVIVVWPLWRMYRVARILWRRRHAKGYIELRLAFPVLMVDGDYYDLLQAAGIDGRETPARVPAAPPLRPATSVVASRVAPAEAVDAGVYSPSQVARGSRFLVQVFLYPPQLRETVAQNAREVDEQAVRRGTYSMLLDVPVGTRVDLDLDMQPLVVTNRHAVVLWRGSVTTVQFPIQVPVSAVGGITIGKVAVAIEGVPIGTLSFKVTLLEPDTANESSKWCETQSVRYRKAFASYSSEDRAEVLRRVQAFRIAGLTVFRMSWT